MNFYITKCVWIIVSHSLGGSTRDVKCIRLVGCYGAEGRFVSPLGGGGVGGGVRSTGVSRTPEEYVKKIIKKFQRWNSCFVVRGSGSCFYRALFFCFFQHIYGMLWSKRLRHTYIVMLCRQKWRFVSCCTCSRQSRKINKRAGHCASFPLFFFTFSCWPVQHSVIFCTRFCIMTVTLLHRWPCDGLWWSYLPVLKSLCSVHPHSVWYVRSSWRLCVPLIVKHNNALSSGLLCFRRNACYRRAPRTDYNRHARGLVIPLGVSTHSTMKSPR